MRKFRVIKMNMERYFKVLCFLTILTLLILLAKNVLILYNISGWEILHMIVFTLYIIDIVVFLLFLREALNEYSLKTK